MNTPPRNDKGKIVKDRQGNPKPDSSLRDFENIPFLEKLEKDENGNLIPQTIEEYFDREVKPHVPDAWIDESKTKIGYEINFTKYFYEFKPLRPLAEIKADILKLKEEAAELGKVVKKFFTTAADGKRYQTSFCSLDAIISVGYRIKPHVATRFRQWATRHIKSRSLSSRVLSWMTSG